VKNNHGCRSINRVSPLTRISHELTSKYKHEKHKYRNRQIYTSRTLTLFDNDHGWLTLNHESPSNSLITSERLRVSNIHGCQTIQPGVAFNPSKSRVDEYQTIRVTQTIEINSRTTYSTHVNVYTTEQVTVSTAMI